MVGGGNGRVFECVVVDLNTQRDFCDLTGDYPVANARELIPALRHMIAWAKRNCAPVVSSVESHRVDELSGNGRPSFCVDGSSGQRKIDFTLFGHCARIEVDNTLSCPIDLFNTFQQVIFRKRTDDLLANPKADRFFTQIPTHRFIVFGVSLEGSVKALTLALLARDKPVTVVVDACGYWNKATADLASRQIVAKGAQLTTVAELLRQRLVQSRFERRVCFRQNRHRTSSGNGNGRHGMSDRQRRRRDGRRESVA